MSSSDTPTVKHVHGPQDDPEGHGGMGDWHVHVVPIWLLVAVFVGLLFFTFVTVAVTWVDLGPLVNLLVALAVAAVKALLVALYFMHLRWDNPMNSLVFVAALVFVTLMIAFCMIDSFSYYEFYYPPAGAPVPR